MSNINSLINAIRTAVYGKDVRGSIANAIEDISKRQDITDSNEITRQTNEDERIVNDEGRTSAEQARVSDVELIKNHYQEAILNMTYKTFKYEKKKYTSTVNGTTSFYLNSDSFNPITDVVELYYSDGTILVEGDDYLIDGTLITLLGWTLDSDDFISWIARKGTSKLDPPGTNGGDIMEGSIRKSALESSVITELDNNKNDISNLQNSFNGNLKYKTVSTTVTNTYIPDDYIFRHLQTQGMDCVLVAMVNIQSATDNNPQIMDNSRITTAISIAKARDVQIQMLKPHLGINWSDGFNRKDYVPSNYDTFFSNWKGILLNYASLCVNNGIPMLCMSCEMVDTTKNVYKTYWQDIYNTIKTQYPNLLLLHAPKVWEFNQAGNVETWEYSDILGTNVYVS